MSIDTIGFVIIDDKEKDFFEITEAITEALSAYTVSVPDVEVTPRIKYARVHFKVRDVSENIPTSMMPIIEKRTLSIHFDCNTDYSHIDARDKVIISLGHWGMSQEIIQHLCKALVDFGDVYFIPNDSEDYWEFAE